MIYDEVWKFVAMKRSGHHAIINWIAEHHPSTVYFTNDANHRGPIPEPGYSTPRDLAERTRNPIVLNRGQGSVLFYNIEEFNPMDDRKTDHCPVDQEPTRRIWIHRGALNLFASRYAHYDKHRPRDPGVESMISEQAFALYNVQVVRLHADDRYFKISYERWLAEESYREEVGRALGLVGNYGEKYSSVSEYGQGSSFTGTDPSKIQTEDRRFETLTPERKQAILERVIDA